MGKRKVEVEEEVEEEEEQSESGSEDSMMGPEMPFPVIRVFFGEVVDAAKPLVVPVPEAPWRLCVTQVNHPLPHPCPLPGLLRASCLRAL
eukprot:1836965-Rhodomonas_salina.4